MTIYDSYDDLGIINQRSFSIIDVNDQVMSRALINDCIINLNNLYIQCGMKYMEIQSNNVNIVNNQSLYY